MKESFGKTMRKVRDKFSWSAHNPGQSQGTAYYSGRCRPRKGKEKRQE